MQQSACFSFILNSPTEDEGQDNEQKHEDKENQGKTK